MRGYNDTSTRQQLPHIFVGTGGGAGGGAGWGGVKGHHLVRLIAALSRRWTPGNCADRRQQFSDHSSNITEVITAYHLASPGHCNSMELKLFNVTFK